MTGRQLTVAHQAPGECAYCDGRHAAIVAAIARELAEQQLAFADQEDGQLNTLCAASYVKGIRDAAGLIQEIR